MRRPRAQFSEPESSVHARSLVDFITNMPEFRFSVHAPESGEEVTTAIETAADVLVRMCAMNLTIYAWCPHCMSGHQIKALDVFLEEKTVTGVNAPLALV